MATPKAAARLNELGQSAWLDLIGRKLVREGGLKRMIHEDGIRGVTANPAIFEKAIAESDEYDEQLAALAVEDKSPLEIYERMAMNDVQNACDVLRPLFDATEGADGFCSLEVSPLLAYETDTTVVEAQRFWKGVDRPNLLVKIPATVEGIPAIRQATALGISVNITLIFSVKVYEQVIEAYLSGLEERHAKGEPLAQIHSVASFFVSRVDSLIDKKLEALGTPDSKSLLGTIAVANAKEAYQLYQKTIDSPRWKKLEEAGATRQRPLWASTGTKNKAYKDTLYVDELIGKDTVNTLPLPTLQAFNDHGLVADTVTLGVPEARRQLKKLGELGIDLEEACRQLTKEGVVLFEKAFGQLLHVIDARASAIRHKRQVRWQEALGRREAEGEAAIASAREGKLGARLWNRDVTLWSSEEKHQAVAKNRLGWLEVHRKMKEHLAEITEFAKAAKERFDHVVLCGMGGSSLCPDVLSRVFGKQPGGLDLRVLDSTAPDAVKNAIAGFALERTLFLISSKSGTTTEPDSFYRHYRSLAKADQFVAITDPGSDLEKLARSEGFLKSWPNPADIGGRYSALSFFGLVPAALLGLDVAALLEEAEHIALVSDAAVPPRDNLAVRLGALLGGLARKGPPSAANKLTLVLSPQLLPFGGWVEQLIAESTGKIGKGILPVDGEPLSKPSVYGDDRVFVSLSLQDEHDDRHDGAVDALAKAGHPVIRWQLPSKNSLGGEFLRWEIATAIAGAVMGLDAFDEPNVTESKEKTKALLGAAKGGTLPAEEPSLRANGVAVFASAAHANILSKAAGTLGPEATRSPAHWLAAHLALGEPGDYVALLAYVVPDDGLHAELRKLQGSVRDVTHLATTSGFGPRFLHSTGQQHKGGPKNGIFVELTVDGGADIAIPGQPYGFATLFAAQARGDLEVLIDHGLRALRLHSEDGDPGKLFELVREAARLIGKPE